MLQSAFFIIVIGWSKEMKIDSNNAQNALFDKMEIDKERLWDIDCFFSISEKVLINVCEMNLQQHH